MGSIIRFTHKECGFEYDFYEGVGFSLFRLQCNAREKMRSGEWGKQWQDLMEKHPEGTATINKALCFCPNCKKYYTEPRIKFYVPNEGFHYDFHEPNEDMVPTYVIYSDYHLIEKETMFCPDCNAESVVMDNLNKVPCPVCGKIRRGRDIGNWD